MPITNNESSTRATILAVDDTPSNLLALRALIELLGVDVVTAESGFAAAEGTLALQ